MNQRHIFFPIALLLAIVFTGCSSVRVSQDYDQTFTFHHHKSYDWFEENQNEQEGIQAENGLLANRFRASIDRRLAQQGFSRSHDHPNYLIAYNFTVTSRLESEPFTTGVGFGYGRYGRHGGIGMSTGTNIRQYDQGKLQISIYDSESRTLIWKGIGTRETYMHSDPDEISRKVDEMVAAILEQFPPSK